MSNSTTIPSARLSSFYFFYFASLGVFVPFFSPYLESLGFDAKEIGILLAIGMGTKIFAPYVLGAWADQTGKRTQLIRLASVLGMIAFIGIWVDQSLWWMALVLAVYSFFWNAALPQFEALTMNYLHDDYHRYSSIRLWGSVGFIIVAISLGLWLEAGDLSVVPIAMFLSLLFIAASSFSVRDPHDGEHLDDSPSLWPILKRPEVIAFFATCFLMQLSHGAYYTFFTIYMESYGYPAFSVGLLWGWGVFAEVIIFVFMAPIIGFLGVYRALILSLVITGVRWIVTALYADQLWVVVISQTGHAASFGLFHAASIYLVHQVFKGRHQGRGQALYSSMSFGAGGAVGALCSGLLWDQIGGEQVFILSGIVALLGCVVVMIGLRNESKHY